MLLPVWGKYWPPITLQNSYSPMWTYDMQDVEATWSRWSEICRSFKSEIPYNHARTRDLGQVLQWKILHLPRTAKVVQECNNHEPSSIFTVKLGSALLPVKACCQQEQQSRSMAREQNWVVVLHDRNEMEYSNKCSYAILYYPPLFYTFPNFYHWKWKYNPIENLRKVVLNEHLCHMPQVYSGTT